MGKESKVKVINVECIDGHLLFKDYRKVGGGRLQKVYREKIGTDLTESKDRSHGEVIYCPECDPPRQVATVTMIHGEVAYKVRHGDTKKVVT